MKKLFPENKASRKSFLEFLDKRGFYIVLILCIAIVAATAFFVTNNNIRLANESEKIIPEEVADNEGLEGYSPSAIGESTALPENKTVQENTGETVQASAQPVQPKPAVTVQPETTKKAAPKQTTPAKSSTTNTADPKAANFIMPVFGQVSFGYASDKLVYSKTLDEWRTHSGIDIAADRGTTVKSVADGVISDIKNDPRYGITVIVDHKNGLKTVYSNLSSNEMVSFNQKVKQGDIIGVIGNTALFETAEESHLHFEVLKDNETVDPTLYLPKK